MRIACCLLLLTGCPGVFAEDTDVVPWTPDRDTATDTDVDTDSDTTGGCPTGMAEPDRSSVTPQITVIDASQLGLVVGTTAYEGVPPVCVSSTGTQVQVLLVQGDDPLLWVRSSAPSATNEPLSTSTGVEVEVFGVEPEVSFGPGDWYEGTWVVSQDELGWVHTINGSSRDGDRSLSMFLEIEVTP